MKDKDISTLVYSGSYNGYSAIAMAYAAYRLKLKSIVFLNSKATGSNKPSNITTIKNSSQIKKLHALNTTIYICPNYRTARNLLYETTQYKNWKMKLGYYIVPMGLNDENGIMINLLSKQIKKSFKVDGFNTMSKIRMWLVAGSGGILMALVKALPNAHFFVLLTGGGKYFSKLSETIKLHTNITVINNYKIEKYEIDDINYHKYYESVRGYDSQIFPYVKKYGENNDFIWNVGSD